MKKNKGVVSREQGIEYHHRKSLGWKKLAKNGLKKGHVSYIYVQSQRHESGKKKKGLTTELIIINTENYISTPSELKLLVFFPK